MTQVKINEVDRKAIIKAMAAARKAGYFAKHNFHACRNFAQDALRETGDIEKYIFSIKNGHANGELFFYWSGDGNALVSFLKAEGLAVEWSGDSHNAIKVKLKPAT